MLNRVFILFALLSLTFASWNPPFYYDCDPRWGNKTVGNGAITFCQGGSLICSLASAMAGYNMTIKNNTITPLTLNSWLKSHNGFYGSEFVWDSIGKLGFKFYGFDTTGPEAAASFQANKLVIINTMSGTVWALVTNITSQSFSVMDPAMRYPRYPFVDVDNAGVYAVTVNGTDDTESLFLSYFIDE